jgi:hypothetical protein
LINLRQSCGLAERTQITSVVKSRAFESHFPTAAKNIWLKQDSATSGGEKYSKFFERIGSLLT